MDALRSDSDAASERTLTATRLLRGAGRGVVGGLVGTVLMTLYRFRLFRALPPTAEFWAKYVAGGEPEQYPVEGFLLHLLYGATGGGVFGLGFALVDVRTEPRRRRSAVALAVAYSAALSLFGTRVLFRRLLAEDLDADEGFVFHVGHLVYGLALGTWLSSRERSGEVYE